jgi:hypothetical protein
MVEARGLATSRQSNLGLWSLATAFLAVIILRVQMDYVYANIVLNYFYYWDFPKVQTWKTWVLSWVVLLLFCPLWLKLVLRRGFSANVCTLLLLMSFVPTTTVLSFGGALSAEFWILVCAYWVVLYLAALKIKTVVLRSGVSRSSTPLTTTVAVVLVVNILAISYQFTGLRLQFNLFDVYANRAEARTYDVNVLLGYLATAADNVLPVLLVFYLVINRYAVATLIAVTIFVNFGISSTKQVLLLLFVALFAWRFGRREPHNAMAFIFGFIALMAACIAEEVFFSSFALADVFAFRLLFIPATLHVEYFEFFRYAELDLLRQTAFKFFFESPYKDNIQFMIGENWIGDAAARANNGLFSDAYYNFGSAGVVIYPILVVLVCKLLEGASRGVDERVTLVAAVAVAFVFLSVPLTQALFNCGLFVLAVVYCLMPKRRASNGGRRHDAGNSGAETPPCLP